ncbi:MAG: hypothetical protein LAO55_08380 [Acidobacteriia bacterium]|nr:hypothetical protein [Terriglobia bacterium]
MGVELVFGNAFTPVELGYSLLNLRVYGRAVFEQLFILRSQHLKGGVHGIVGIFKTSRLHCIEEPLFMVRP